MSGWDKFTRWLDKLLAGRDSIIKHSIMKQKITMLIEVVPSPRLDVVRECGDSGPVAKTVNNAVYATEVHASCLAFDVTPEDLFLLDSESMEAIRSGAQKSVIVVFSNSKFDDGSDSDCDAEQQNSTKVRLTFIPISQKSKFVDETQLANPQETKP